MWGRGTSCSSSLTFKHDGSNRAWCSPRPWTPVWSSRSGVAEGWGTTESSSGKMFWGSWWSAGSCLLVSDSMNNWWGGRWETAHLIGLHLWPSLLIKRTSPSKKSVASPSLWGSKQGGGWGGRRGRRKGHVRVSFKYKPYSFSCRPRLLCCHWRIWLWEGESEVSPSHSLLFQVKSNDPRFVAVLKMKP